MENNNLPVKVGERRLTEKAKALGKRTGKILASGIVSLGFDIGIVASVMFAPYLTIPAMVGSVFCTQKFLNQTYFRSYKDLAFIVAKNKGREKIYQDVTRLDLTNKMKGFTNVEKAAFMQLQAIIGFTKFKAVDKKGREVTFETDTHGINQKTFRKLQELGYLKDYEEKFLKSSRLLLPKLAFGNTHEFNKKVKIYNVKFKMTGKPLDLENEDLRRYFPMVFGEKNGIVANKGYNFIREADGSLTIDYSPEVAYIQRKTFPIYQKKTMKEELKEGAPTLEEQKQHITERTEEQKTHHDNTELEK